jgi:hypothetical protein
VPLPVRLDRCTVAVVKLLAATASAALLLGLGCLAPLPAGAAPKHAPPAQNCPRQHIRVATIYEVADSTVGSGSRVRLGDAVLTAVSPSGLAAWIGAQPGDPGYAGPGYSGIEIDLSALRHPPPLAVGDLVRVQGTVTWDTAGNWVGAEALSVRSTGQSVDPVAVDAASLLAPAESGPLDAVLVSTGPLTLASESASEWTMSDGIVLGDAIIGELPPVFLEGAVFESVTGIADTLGGGPVLLPREFADIHLGD